MGSISGRLTAGNTFRFFRRWLRGRSTTTTTTTTTAPPPLERRGRQPHNALVEATLEQQVARHLTRRAP